jgi:hypothetical protein
MGAHAEAAFELLRDTLRVTSGPASPDDIVKLLGHALHAHNVHLAELPAGFTVEVAERNMDGFMRGEVAFDVVQEGERVAQPRAVEDRCAGEWLVMPGPQSACFDAQEARARAVALLLAAAEVEKRNGEGRL